MEPQYFLNPILPHSHRQRLHAISLEQPLPRF
jgi:hypothetical protein